jgi:hypothetical protein
MCYPVVICKLHTRDQRLQGTAADRLALDRFKYLERGARSQPLHTTELSELAWMILGGISEPLMIAGPNTVRDQSTRVVVIR